MKNNRKNRNKEKITNRNNYRLKKYIRTKAYLKINNELEADEMFIENQQIGLVSKCFKASNIELKKWGLKNYYLEEIKVENMLGQQANDFIRNILTLLVVVEYRIKFIN